MAVSIDLSGKVALVTGAGHGIGASVALAMGAAGARTVVNYRKSAAQAEEIAARIRAEGGQALAVQADVTDEGEVARMKETVEKEWGPVDILVNNALHQLPWKPFAEQKWETFQGQVDGSLKALCVTGWAFLPEMRKRRFGRIININTVCFMECGPNQAAYVAGKGAMFGWSRTLAREVAPDNVTVNQIAPGWMKADEAPPTEHQINYAKQVPMRRQGHASEIANAALFFASDLAGFVTGSYLPVCGGLFIW